MKTLPSRLTYLLCLACLLVSCREIADDYGQGEAWAYANGWGWRGEPTGFKRNDRFSLSIYVNDPVYGFLRQTLGFYDLPFTPGDTLWLSEAFESDLPSAYFGTSVSDGDVQGSNYTVVPGRESYLLLDELVGGRVVQGRFEALFAKDPNDWYPNDPDTLRFTEGHFVTVLWDY